MTRWLHENIEYRFETVFAQFRFCLIQFHFNFADSFTKLLRQPANGGFSQV